MLIYITAWGCETGFAFWMRWASSALDRRAQQLSKGQVVGEFGRAISAVISWAGALLGPGEDRSEPPANIPALEGFS